jgi:hypothetical protein
MTEILIGKIQWPFLAQFLFATRCLLQPEHRTVVDKSGMIRTQMGSAVDQKMVAAAWDAL